MYRLRLALLLGASAALLLNAAGCDTYHPDSAGQQYVVEVYLKAGGVMPPVYLSRTTPIEREYITGELVVSNAEVRIQHLEEGQATQTFRYRESENRAGLYRPVYEAETMQGEPRIEPLGRYRLEIIPPAGDGIDVETITAETVVPDTFSIVRTSGEALTWGEDELQVTITRSRYPGRRARFVVTTTAFEAARENLTPLAEQALDRLNSDDFEIEDLSVTESPVINEGNYEVDANGLLTVTIPWLVTNFYGSNEVALRALGDNYYDFVRSQSVQQGGSSFTPGEIPNVIDRISGGTGLFGSYAVARYNLEVERP